MTADQLEDVRLFLESMPDETKRILREHHLGGTEAAARGAAEEAPIGELPRGYVFAMGFLAGAIWGSTRP